VSVLSPTYQHAAFIGDCIRSVLAQTVQDWEMMIVDDGSEDGTPDIAESFHDPRIVVLRRQHGGVAGLGRAYALAVASSGSPLVAILEGDDTWPPTKLEDQLHCSMTRPWSSPTGQRDSWTPVVFATVLPHQEPTGSWQWLRGEPRGRNPS